MPRQFIGALLALAAIVGCTISETGLPSPTTPSETSSGPDFAHTTGNNRLPTCSGASDCAAGPVVCVGEGGPATVAPSVIADYADGLSSDGRGSYVQGVDGVRNSVIVYVTGVSFEKASKSIKNPRKYTVNLNDPVPGGGGVPLGLITDGNDNNLEIQWFRSGDTRQNLHNIPVGTTVTANQIDITFHINGRFHILQMGPQPYGHCHEAPTAVFGTGTSSGAIFRASETKWVVDLPAGSVGRLFDLYNTDQYAVDKGLYYVRLHYEIGN